MSRKRVTSGESHPPRPIDRQRAQIAIHADVEPHEHNGAPLRQSTASSEEMRADGDQHGVALGTARDLNDSEPAEIAIDKESADEGQHHLVHTRHGYRFAVVSEGHMGEVLKSSVASVHPGSGRRMV